MTREEAINKVRQMSLPKETMDILEALAPELRESEDEEIRKGLVNFILYKAGHLLDEETEHKFIAYLEKQKEQKHPNGCFTCDEYKKGYEEGRRNGFTAGYNKAMKEVEQKEQKLADDTTFEKWLDDWYQGSKEAGGDVVMSEAEFKNWSRGIRNMYQQKSAEWSEEDEQRIAEIEFAVMQMNTKRVDTKDKCLAWLKSLRPQSKQEWSEEDERILKGIIGLIDHDQHYGVSNNEMISWLKTLRPQPRAKTNDYITPHKKFFQWIYNRLIDVHGENPNVDYMQSFKKRIDNLQFDEPRWKPSEDEVRLINTSISFLKDFADKGYENAVECIDWLKSKLNGNTCK